MDKKWNFKNPIFEYSMLYQDNHMPWAGHKYFAHDLVVNTKPSCIVELGTHKGTSLFSFAQAIKDNGLLSCKLYGIDTWEGDLNTGPYQGEKVYQEVSAINQEYYAEVDIQLLRMLFDKALSQFKDESIDILHIDGLHTYDAVKHDYTTWRDKVKPNGIILFHDIMVEKENFGVKKYWAEIKNDFAFSLSFPHSNGLGVGFKSKPIFDFSNLNQLYLHYILKSYDSTKYSLYKISYKERELEEIKNSKYWNVKERIKKIIGKS